MDLRSIHSFSLYNSLLIVFSLINPEMLVFLLCLNYLQICPHSSSAFPKCLKCKGKHIPTFFYFQIPAYVHPRELLPFPGVPFPLHLRFLQEGFWVASSPLVSFPTASFVFTFANGPSKPCPQSRQPLPTAVKNLYITVLLSPS